VIKFFQSYKERKRTSGGQGEQINREAPGGVMPEDLFAKRVGNAIAAGVPGCLVLFETDKPKQAGAGSIEEPKEPMADNVMEILTKNFRKSDYFSQLKEGEYAIWLNGIAEADISCIGRRVSAINDRLLHPREQSGFSPVTVSAGAVFGGNAADFKELHKKAGRALYQVKVGGRCGFQIYIER
jgi:GGDEF domain-containing protein